MSGIVAQVCRNQSPDLQSMAEGLGGEGGFSLGRDPTVPRAANSESNQYIALLVGWSNIKPATQTLPDEPCVFLQGPRLNFKVQVAVEGP